MLAKLPLVEPVYPLTEGLGLNVVRKAVEAALDATAGAARMAGRRVAARSRTGRSFGDALRRCIARTIPPTSTPDTPAWSRLAYDELLAGQLALALVRAQSDAPRRARRAAATASSRKKIIAALPYSLTPSQARAVDEIVADLGKPERMLRLLQGDVGSGKTVVALLAAATVIEAGRQAALMAPTEILARQHLATIAPLAEAAGIARRDPDRPRARQGARRHARRGSRPASIDLLVGTHALFQDEVAFRDLALAVVDEQHRFGVHQRLALAAQGRGRRHAGDDRDADPAHAGAHLLRRHGCLANCARSRPAASRSTPAPLPLERLDEVDRRGRPRARRAASASIGSARWSRNPRSRSRRRRGALRRR